MKEIDITSLLTPQVLELISANPDILSIIFNGGKSKDEKLTEALEALSNRLVELEKELSDLKTLITKDDSNRFKNTGNRKFPLY